ncbi:MAG: archease [Actinobacteria bacterium]|nr:archease [Actinomycetota bacterium]
MRFKTIEHTADIGIEVEADTLGELFEGTAMAMLSLIVDPATVRDDVERELSLEAGDLEELLFIWLNELLFIMYADGLLFSKFEVKDVGDSRLVAVASGERLDRGRHRLDEEIKAATYHEMMVERLDEGWKARVIFDV